MWSRLDHYWSTVHQQDHRYGCLLKHFILNSRHFPLSSELLIFFPILYPAVSGQPHNSLVFSSLYVFTLPSSSCVLSPVFSSFCSDVECVSSDSQDVTNERALLIAPPAKQNLGLKNTTRVYLRGWRPGVTSGLASHKFIDLRISEWTFQFFTPIDAPQILQYSIGVPPHVFFWC